MDIFVCKLYNVKNARVLLILPLQYDGDWTPEPVKKHIIEIMYSWTVGLPKETKIAEAYKMLKQQGKIMDFLNLILIYMYYYMYYMYVVG